MLKTMHCMLFERSARFHKYFVVTTMQELLHDMNLL